MYNLHEESFLTKRKVIINWVILFLIKLFLIYGYCQLAFNQEPYRRIGNLSFASGDDYSYIGAMETYIQEGKYYFVNQLGDTIRAGRSPHYTIPYWIARQATGREKHQAEHHESAPRLSLHIRRASRISGMLGFLRLKSCIWSSDPRHRAAAG